jgi:apolipoprotein N-acyltransferase
LIEAVLVLLQIITEGFTSKKRSEEKPFGLVFVIGWFVAGAAIGWISLFVVKHSMVSIELLRYASLFGYPLAAGLISYFLGRYHFPSESRPLQVLHFLRAFAFAFGLLLVRHQHFAIS